MAMRKQRERLYDLQGGNCHYCKRHCLRERDWGNRNLIFATADHILPRSKNGAYGIIANTVMACNECNWLRGSLAYDVFINVLVSCNYQHRVASEVIKNSYLNTERSAPKVKTYV